MGCGVQIQSLICAPENPYGGRFFGKKTDYDLHNLSFFKKNKKFFNKQ